MVRCGWLTSRIPALGILSNGTAQENIMHTLLRAGAIALVLFGSAGLAVAQDTPGGAGGGNAQDQLKLTPAQKQTIRQGLMSEQTQTTPGSQGQVGSKAPGSGTPRALPTDVKANGTRTTRP